MSIEAVIAGIVVAATGVVCLFLATNQYMELQFELNQQLPEGQKFEPLFWTLRTHQQFRQLQREVLPKSSRPQRALRLGIVGLCLFFSGVELLVAVANFY